MGCDIHLMVEKRVGTYGDNGEYSQWAAVRKMPTDSWLTERAAKEKENGEVGYYTRRLQALELAGGDDHWFYDGRNYDVFAMLANVRNGYGFAGVDTGDGFTPIAMPKGVPDDASNAYETLVRSWSDDGHSHSYLTLRELLEYDWQGQKTYKRGWVGEQGFKDFLETGEPESWSGGISGEMVRHVSNEQMRAIVNGEVTREEGKSYYTQVEWEITYYDHASTFVDNLPLLQELSEDGIGEDVRIVFFFDN